MPLERNVSRVCVCVCVRVCARVGRGGGRERRKNRIPWQAVKDVDHASTYFIMGNWKRKCQLMSCDIWLQVLCIYGYSMLIWCVPMDIVEKVKKWLLGWWQHHLPASLTPHNMLDFSAPLVKRGEEWKTPKSPALKAILKEREEKVTSEIQTLMSKFHIYFVELFAVHILNHC